MKSDRRRPTKVDTSRKTETSVNKLAKQSSREAVKNEKFRSGSIDRAAVGRIQDTSRSRLAKSVDRAPKEPPKVAADAKEKGRSSIRKNSIEMRTKPSGKKSESQKPIVPSSRDKYKSTTQERNDVSRSRASVPKKENKVTDSRKPASNSSSKKASSNSSSTSVKSSDRKREHIDDRKRKSSSSRKLSVNDEKTGSFVAVLPEEESQPVRPGTSTVRKGPAVEDASGNISGPPPENQENIKKSAKVSHTPAPSANDENNAEEEYNYEDDFEDYDSDFEEESDTDSASDTESSQSNEPEKEEKEASETEMNVTPSQDEENAAGLFLHPTIVKRIPPGNKPATKAGNRAPRQVLRMSERIRNYEVPKDEPPSVSSSMKNSRSFINFAGAKEERQKKKVSNQILKRGMELLEIITLDKVSYDVFDMPPMKYDVYIRSFGKSNTKQAFIQTENTEDEEVETDEIEVREKWTQHPPNDHLGVGGDVDLIVDRSDTDWQSHFKTDAVKLNNFVQNVAPVVLALLAEELPHLSLRQITERRPDVFFSQGYYNLVPLPFCKDAPVIHLCCSPVSENYLISVHGNMCTFPSTEVPAEEKGVICIWNLYDISRPEFALISNSQPACSCFGPGNSSTVVAGMVDGSVMLWDLTEPSSGHYQYQHGSSEIVLRSPTYNTAAVIGEDQHHGCVVSIQAAHYSNSQTNPLKDGVNDKGSSKTFHVLSLEDMGVLNVWVVIEVLKLDPSGSESDLGLSPGGKLRLIRSSTILLHSLNILSPDLLAGIRTFEFRMLPSDLNHVLVTTDAGIVLHVTRHSGNAFPKYFSYDVDLSTEIRSIDCSPHNDTLFLVGCSDGSVRLHSIKSARPVMIWPQAAGGEPVLLVQWSANQPAVFYVLDTVSHIYVWDLRKNTTKPTQMCHFDGPRVTWFALNGRNHRQTDSGCPSLMAVAKENGVIEVHALKQQIDVISEAEYNRQIQFMQSL